MDCAAERPFVRLPVPHCLFPYKRRTSLVKQVDPCMRAILPPSHTALHPPQRPDSTSLQRSMVEITS